MKKCSKCKEIKEKCEFGKASKNKDGVNFWCKSCRKQYRKDNADMLKEKQHIYYKNNADTINFKKRLYNEKNADYIKIKSKEYQTTHVAQISITKRVYRERKKEETSEQRAIDKQNKIQKKLLDKEMKKEERKIKDALYRKKYGQDNRKEITQKQAERLKNNPELKIKKNLRNRLLRAINSDYKSGSAVSDLGCSISDFKIYLEERFFPNQRTGEIMSWDNWSRSGWHIDHIKPLSSFDLTNREELLKACHCTNLQPLWARENIIKRNK